MMKMKAHQDRKTIEFNDKVSIAYRAAIFHRIDKLTAKVLEDYLIKPTDDQIELTDEDKDAGLMAALANYKQNLPQKKLSDPAE